MRLLVILLLAVLIAACGKPSSTAPAPAAASGDASELCEHGVQRSVCTKCNPNLIPVFQAKHDWCAEHGFPESFCPICHPERGGRPPNAKRETKSAGGGDHDEDNDEKKVQLADDVLAKAGVRVAPAVKEVLVPTLTLPGEVQPDPDKTARVTAPVGGRIDKVTFKQGSAVKKGDVLAVIRVPDLGKTRAAFASSNARAMAARNNANRLAELAQKGLAAQQEALAAKAEADALEADARAASEQLNALGTGTEGGGSLLTLRAPVSGVVVSRDAVLGQAVTTEQAIASIVDLDEVWFLARVYEKDLGRLAIGNGAEVQLNAFPKDRFVGTVEYISQQVDPGSRTFTARVRLTNKSGKLRVGLFGKARIALTEESSRGPVLVVPTSAITDIKGKPSAFVKEGDGFELRDLSLGERSVGKVEVLKGIREGEPVAVDGVFTLKSVLLKGSMGDDD